MIRIICGIISADQGRVRVFDKDPKKHWQIRRDIGIVEDEDSYFPELTASEFIWWVGRLRKLTDKQCQEEIEQLAQMFFIEKRLDNLIGALSHGMRRKVEIAAALIGKPRLIILDEPTNGLDVDSVEVLCETLKKQRENGGAAIVACHDRAFIERVCTDRVTLENGAVVKQEAMSC